MEEHEKVEALNAVGHTPNSQLPYTESESNSSSTVSTCCSSSSSTMLDHLRTPTPSTLARKRKIGVNSALPKGKKRASGQALKVPYVPKGFTPSQRASEFPGEQLVVSAGKLFWCNLLLLLQNGVFSLLKNAFGEQQQSSLNDLVAATLMVQYNKCGLH